MHRQMIYAMVTAGEKVKIVKMRVLVLALLALTMQKHSPDITL